MTDSTKGLPPRKPFAAGEQQRGPFDRMGDVVEYVITRIFAIGEKDAQSLVLEVLLAYQDIKHPPHDVNAWLIAGACANAKKYLERQGLWPGNEAEKTRAAERWLRREEALALLSDHSRTVLRLRLEERKTDAEIAAVLGVTPRAAKRIVLRAVAELRELTRGGRGIGMRGQQDGHAWRRARGGGETPPGQPAGTPAFRYACCAYCVKAFMHRRRNAGVSPAGPVASRRRALALRYLRACVNAPAISSSGSTCSAAPRRIASRGMPKTMLVASSWAMVGRRRGAWSRRPVGAVVAHAGQERAAGVFAGGGGDGAEEDVDAGAVAGDEGAVGEGDVVAAGVALDAHVLVAGGDEGAGRW